MGEREAEQRRVREWETEREWEQELGGIGSVPTGGGTGGGAAEREGAASD